MAVAVAGGVLVSVFLCASRLQTKLVTSEATYTAEPRTRKARIAALRFVCTACVACDAAYCCPGLSIAYFSNRSSGGAGAANAAVDQPSRRFRPPDQSLCVGNGVVITAVGEDAEGRPWQRGPWWVEPAHPGQPVTPLLQAFSEGRGRHLPEPKGAFAHDVAALPQWLGHFLQRAFPHNHSEVT